MQFYVFSCIVIFCINVDEYNRYISCTQTHVYITKIFCRTCLFLLIGTIGASYFSSCPFPKDGFDLVLKRLLAHLHVFIALLVFFFLGLIIIINSSFVLYLIIVIDFNEV